MANSESPPEPVKPIKCIFKDDYTEDGVLMRHVRFMQTHRRAPIFRLCASPGDPSEYPDQGRWRDRISKCYKPQNFCLELGAIFINLYSANGEHVGAAKLFDRGKGIDLSWEEVVTLLYEESVTSAVFSPSFESGVHRTWAEEYAWAKELVQDGFVKEGLDLAKRALMQTMFYPNWKVALCILISKSESDWCTAEAYRFAAEAIWRNARGVYGRRDELDKLAKRQAARRPAGERHVAKTFDEPDVQKKLRVSDVEVMSALREAICTRCGTVETDLCGGIEYLLVDESSEDDTDEEAAQEDQNIELVQLEQETSIQGVKADTNDASSTASVKVSPS